MASVLPARPDVDAIRARATQARPGRMMATVLAAVLFAAGWALAQAFTWGGRACAGAWIAAAWCWFAIAEGWESARPAKPEAPRRRGR